MFEQRMNRNNVAIKGTYFIPLSPSTPMEMPSMNSYSISTTTAAVPICPLFLKMMNLAARENSIRNAETISIEMTVSV